VTLNGESVAIGNALAFARVIASGNLNIFADYYAPSAGGVTMANAGTLLQVAGNLQIGSNANTYGSGSPNNVNLSAGDITAGGTFNIFAVGSITTANVSIDITGTFSMAAQAAISINSGSILTANSALSLLSDADGNMQGALTLAANTANTDPTIYDPTATVTLSGYTVTNNAAIIDLHLVITPGH